MLKTALKIDRIFFVFEVDPKKYANLMRKEKVKRLRGENFKDFAVSLTVFELWQFHCFYFACSLDRGNFYGF